MSEQPTPDTQRPPGDTRLPTPPSATTVARQTTAHEGARSTDEVRRDRLGRFEVHGEIGHGGMGTVLRGRDPALGRELALKVLPADLHDSTDARSRFHEEAQIAGQLQHPGIVPVYELGADSDGRPFFAMKLVDGQTLATLLSERHSSADSLPRFLTIFEQVCQTVAYAHSRGVIHRDLKPANIMVGAFGEVQVMDWGLAKVLDERRGSSPPSEPDRDQPDGSSAQTRAGTRLGTPAYMAPEQARGEVDRLDRRTDVFGLGGILCEVLTRQPPFLGADASELVRRSAAGDLHDTFARLDACGADPELVRLAWACLTPEPDARPPDGSAVATQVTAYRAGVEERLRRAELKRAAAEARAVEERRRRRAQLALAGTVLLLLTVGAGGGWYLRQQHLEHQAEQARQETERVRREAEQARAIESGLFDLGQERQKPRPDWSKVRQLLERVEGRLEQGGSEELQQRVQRVRNDLARVRKDQEMVRRLDEARLRYAAAGDVGFDAEGSGKLFASALAWYGLDVGQGRPEEIASQIEASTLREELVIALDRWANLSAPAQAKRLLAIADCADSNAWRRQLRGALRRQDSAGVQRLADEANVGQLPPASIVFLAAALRQVGAAQQSIGLLREGRQRYPQDLWLNFDLAQALHNAFPPQGAEAVRYYTAAQVLRPDSVGILNNLAIALKDQRQLAEAVHACREAIRLKPDFAVTHNTLGAALHAQGKLAEAVVEYREAIRLQADYHPAHSNLGLALAEQGKLADAIAACREAIQLKPGFAHAHNNLGIALKKQRKLPQAIAAYREAIRLRGDFPEAHCNLGIALADQGKLPQAEAAFHAAIRLRPAYPNAHHSLGLALQHQGKLPQAVAAYREAIRLGPDHAEAHCNLGSALREQGEFAASLAALRRGHALGVKTPGWAYPSAQWVREAERLVKLDRRLPAILAGTAKPVGAAEQIEFAGVCISKRRYAAAVRLFADAFEADARLPANLVKGYRYNAACCAVLTAAGKDVEAKPLDEAGRARLRSQALGWLRADLDTLGKRLAGGKPAYRAFVAGRLRDWLADADLAAMRDADALARLPEAERGDWRKLWDDVNALRQRAAGGK
jgi:serine/threonine-protein kinase